MILPARYPDIADCVKAGFRIHYSAALQHNIIPLGRGDVLIRRMHENGRLRMGSARYCDDSRTAMAPTP